MQNFEFRKYQQQAVEDAMTYIASKNKKPQVMILPTAAGKSWIIAGIAKKYKDKILVLQSSVELLNQNYDKFCKLGGVASIYSASLNKKEISHVTYATIGSIGKKAEELKELGFNLVIFDECHAFLKAEAGSQFKKFIDIVKPNKCIGLTATAFRLVTTGFGTKLQMLHKIRPNFFKGYIHVTQIDAIIKEGYWTKSLDEIWEFDSEELDLNTTGTDFTVESVIRVVQDLGINNNIYKRVKSLLEEGERKSILVFVDSVENTQKFSTLFPESACLTSDTPKKERKQIIEDFQAGKIKVLFNHKILTTGFDCDLIDCIIIGYPTNSLSLFYQMYGRGTRIRQDKENFLLIDCCGNFERLGHPRELSYKEVSGKGLCLFSGPYMKTGVYLGIESKITQEELESVYEQSNNPTKITFGKHSGKNIRYLVKVDPQYLKWLTNQSWLDKKLKESILQAFKEEVLS